MTDKVTVAAFSSFIENDFTRLERALHLVEVSQDECWLRAKVSIERFLAKFDLPPEVEEHLWDIRTFTYNHSNSLFSSWNISPSDLSKMRKKIDDLLLWLDNQYPKAGVFNLRRR